MTPRRSTRAFLLGLMVVLAISSFAGGSISSSIHAAYTTLDTRLTHALSQGGCR